MSELSVYRMSEAGACPRALCASHQGYETPPNTESAEVVMREGTRHEAWVAEDLKPYFPNAHMEEAGRLEEAGRCSICPDERYGHHVEIETVLWKAVGHIDRYIVTDGIKYPLEIKALGRYRWEEFQKHGFSSFPEYEIQFLCYCEGSGHPGYYAVKNRDTGKILLYSVMWRGKLPPYPKGTDKWLEIKQTWDDLSLKLDTVEIAVREGELLTAFCEEKKKKWCKYSYLCTDLAPPVIKPEPEELLQAAIMWRAGKGLKAEGEALLEEAEKRFLAYCQTTEPKTTVDGLSVAFLGMRTRKTIDKDAAVAKWGEDEVALVTKESKPWPDLKVKDTRKEAK